MKLLLSLILIISIALSNSNAYKISSQKINAKHEKINKFSDQHCFVNGVQSLSAYRGAYALAAYDINTVAVQGVTQESFYEQGYFDVDYVNERVFSTFQVSGDGYSVEGAIWAFKNNETEYLVSSDNGQLVCYSGPLQVSIPSTFNIAYVGDLNLGTFPTEAFIVYTPGNVTTNTLLVNKLDCSVTSIYSENNGPVGNEGFSIQNVFNYSPVSEPSDFNLPSVCFTNPTPLGKAHAHKLRKSIKLPKFLNQ